MMHATVQSHEKKEARRNDQIGFVRLAEEAEDKDREQSDIVVSMNNPNYPLDDRSPANLSTGPNRHDLHNADSPLVLRDSDMNRATAEKKPALSRLIRSKYLIAAFAVLVVGVGFFLFRFFVSTPAPVSPLGPPLGPPVLPPVPPPMLVPPHPDPFLKTSVSSAAETLISRPMQVTYSVCSLPLKNITLHLLCRLGASSSCYMSTPSEVVDVFAAVIVFYRTPLPLEKVQRLYDYSITFANYIESVGLKTCTLESVGPGEEYVITQPNNEPTHIQIENNEYFFKRDNLINVAIQRLLKITEWEYFAWIDAHQMFLNPYWWEEAILKLEKFGAVQLFSRMSYLDKTNSSITWPGISYHYGLQLGIYNMLPFTTFNGNALSITRSTYQKIGYICDEGVGGNTDACWSFSTRFNFVYECIYPDCRVFKLYYDEVAPILNKTSSCVDTMLVHLDHEHMTRYDFIQAYFNQLMADNTSLSMRDFLVRGDDGMLTLKDQRINEDLIHLVYDTQNKTFEDTAYYHPK